ncbi:MAG: hypothetical protein J6Y47_07785 [Bacteroidales bacterium]|nr:hypothetical protein [Bacteroidales bacterium]
MENIGYDNVIKSIQIITKYYTYLVDVTKNKQLVGSTNEWVLDNFFIISEQEKVLKVDLRSPLMRTIKAKRKGYLQNLLYQYLQSTYFLIDKQHLFNYLSQYQKDKNDYFSYLEICLIPLYLKVLLIHELSDLCVKLQQKIQLPESGVDLSKNLDQATKENLLMMNLFNSLKKMTKLEMEDVFTHISYSEKCLMQEQADMYSRMCDQTKSDYRNRIIRMAKKKHMSEYAFVQQLVQSADKEHKHVGWYLFPPKAWNARAHAYASIVSAVTLLSAVLIAWLSHSLWAFLLLLIPMSQWVIDVSNHILYILHRPISTFKLKFDKGIPQEYATMVIVPTIIKTPEKVRQMLDQLEVYYLSNRSDNLYFTLVGDASAEQAPDMPWDADIVEAGEEKVRALNEKYEKNIFNFVYRNRVFSKGENCYLGWERKRGAILHFNDLLLGNLSQAEKQQYFRYQTLDDFTTDITFVITLDTDTELVLYSAHKLIGAMAHPLNRAVLAPDGKKVISGYGIMQPRINVDVEVTNKSRYAQLFAGLGGLDVYTTASFELYQDIFNEGSFCGKGIYDIKIFQQVLKGTFPQNLILSHDLLEGCHIRCGLINDVELFDDNPSNYIDDAKRHHRWARGDWQIISWLGARVKNEAGQKVKNQVNTIGKWKIFDNLRRSMLSLFLLLTLFYGFTIGNINPIFYLLLVLVIVGTPIFFFLVSQLLHLQMFSKRFKYYMTLLHGIAVVLYKSFITFALIPIEAWMYTDAIIRSLYRMGISHKNLLNWVPSDEAAKSTKNTLAAYVKRFMVNIVVSLAFAAAVWYFHVYNAAIISVPVLIAAVFVILSWCGAPLLMYFLGQKFSTDEKHLKAAELEDVKEWAKRTWHFFDMLMTEDTNYLIPDNYQFNRAEKKDYKTSPTNIGYSLTAIVSAVELNYIGVREAVERIEHVIDTVVKLKKWNGHLFNWYHIHTMEALTPYFVSTADSGNFVACLYVVQGFLEKQLLLIEQHHLSSLQQSAIQSLLSKVCRLIDRTDFSKLYNPALDVFSIGYDYREEHLLPYHYNNFASEARLTSFLTIAKGDAPYKHWFCLDKTLVQYKRYKGVASWYGTLFEYFMPLIFLKTYKHTLMDETYSFAVLAQRAFIQNVNHARLKEYRQKTDGTASFKKLPWGISETAYHELDDAQNYKYRAFGVPYLKFQNTTPDRIVISPYSSLLAISVQDRGVYENMQRFKELGMYNDFGFYESYDEEDEVRVEAHYAHHQGMILASLTNYLCNHCIQEYFQSEKSMQAMETLLKEKVQIKPYIDLKVTKYKRYQYSKVRQESDVREYDHITNVPEIGMLSNGDYTVLLNDRGAGFSRYKNVYINRYRKISAESYGQFMYIRNLQTDDLWCNTYAPLYKKPDKYRVIFASDKVKYLREDKGIVTNTEVTVVKDHNAEIRKYTFENHTSQGVTLELTSYAEVLLCRKDADEAHRVFNGMMVYSEFDRNTESLIFSRPVRENRDAQHFIIQKMFLEKDTPRNIKEALNASNDYQYETSRLNFLGRNRNAQHAVVIETRQNLSNTVGTTLDPVMSMRRWVHLNPEATATVYVITGFGKSRQQVLQIVQLYNNKMAINNAFELATVYSNMRTAYSLFKGEQMYLYNCIAKYMLQTATCGVMHQQALANNVLSQSALWKYGISGDLAILLLEIDSADKSSYAKEILQAFEYYKNRGMYLDVVIINDAPDGQQEQLTKYINDMANLEHLSYVHNPIGKVYVVNGYHITDAERTLFRTVARVSFSTVDDLSITEQIAKMESEYQYYQDKEHYDRLNAEKNIVTDAQSLQLAFYNRYGGFTSGGKQYVIHDTNTPLPWVNVLANPHFGCIVSATMSGFTYAYNAQQFKLTSWSNDMAYDPSSEMLLVQKKQFIPTNAIHGLGYSRFEACYTNYKVQVQLFVAKDSPTKFYHISLTNLLPQEQTLQLSMVYKLVLGTNEEETARYLFSEWKPQDNTLYVRNMYHAVYGQKQVCLSATETIEAAKIDYPNRKMLSVNVTIPANATKKLAFVIACRDVERTPYRQWSIPEIEEQCKIIQDYWQNQLSVIQVETADDKFNYMVNYWYLYQVYSARLFARAGFYQVGGAIGFRDQLQDVMSVLYSNSDYARKQILTHASHQFVQGDVLHWWHDDLRIGARTTFSDDYLWLIYVTYQYVTITGDEDILGEMVPYAEAEMLRNGEAERGMSFSIGEQKDTLYRHLQLCVEKALRQMGSHHLPLMGCGDWNDGMSKVGVEGKGESVWVAFFLVDLLPKMADLSRKRGDEEFAEKCENAIPELRQALQDNAWDGAWFLRAYFDNGDSMGSRNNAECQIDLISQSWSILTNVATEEQKHSIFKEVETRLVNKEHEIIQLLTPAFKLSKNNPGYIMDYPKGVRENGGQYTHGAMWYIMALLQEGKVDQAYFYYSLINPIHRTSTLADVLKYKVEPYCIAADIYANRQHAGQGGWTWYTGSASWAYKVGVENILGLQVRGTKLSFNPHVPTSWSNFTIHYRYGNTIYHCHCHFAKCDVPKGKWNLTRLSENNIDTGRTEVAMQDDGLQHNLDWFFE